MQSQILRQARLDVRDGGGNSWSETELVSVFKIALHEITKQLTVRFGNLMDWVVLALMCYVIIGACSPFLESNVFLFWKHVSVTC